MLDTLGKLYARGHSVAIIGSISPASSFLTLFTRELILPGFLSTAHQLSGNSADLKRRSDCNKYQSVPSVSRLANEGSQQFLAQGPFRGKFGRGLLIYDDSRCGMYGAADSED
jgi:hypothetical protein